jgi:hypothetical protein
MSSTITYVRYRDGDNKPKVRRGELHRISVGSATIELLIDRASGQVCTRLRRLDGLQGKALKRKLQREARQEGLDEELRTRAICVAVASLAGWELRGGVGRVGISLERQR